MAGGSVSQLVRRTAPQQTLHQGFLYRWGAPVGQPNQKRHRGEGKIISVEVRFARDSPLEGDGFGLPVPREITEACRRHEQTVGRWTRHPPGSANCLQARGDIDAVAVNVVAVDDDVADIDSDAQGDALVVGMSASRSTIARWISTAQRTASTTLGNSTSTPSPVSLTMRPRCFLIFGSVSWRRCAFSRSSVPSSSAPIIREYPATSAARIAARPRWTGWSDRRWAAPRPAAKIAQPRH